MTQERQPVSVEYQREFVVAYLERERELWLPAKARADRAGGMSAEANEAEAVHMRRIDALLDEYQKIGGVALGGAQ